MHLYFGPNWVTVGSQLGHSWVTVGSQLGHMFCEDFARLHPERVLILIYMCWFDAPTPLLLEKHMTQL